MNPGLNQQHGQDRDANPVAQASVYSTFQPAGALQLNGVKSQTGDVTFADATSGAYTIEISKSGYKTETLTVLVAVGQTIIKDVKLTAQT